MRTLVRVLVTAALLSIPVLYSSCGDGGGGGTGPDEPPAETLASFELTVPDAILEGEAFSLTVTAVGSRGSRPFTSFTGTVSLSTTLGTVTPSNLTVATGTGSGQVILSQRGEQVLTASSSGKIGSRTVQVARAPALSGEGSDPVEGAIPDSLYYPDASDFSNDHPDLPGIFVSHNTMMVVFDLGMTVSEANSMLAEVDGEVVGGIPGSVGVLPGILFVQLPTTSHAEFQPVLSQIRSNPKVARAVPDALMGQDRTTMGSGGAAPGWTWDATPNGGNWGLELCRVPQMWNLMGAVEKSEACIWTAVVDWGFDDQHKDLSYFKSNPSGSSDHGAHVAGIIGGGFDNGFGMDGINPRTGLIVHLPEVKNATDIMGALASLGQAMRSALFGLAESHDELSVFNFSMGYLWSDAELDPGTNEQAADLASDQGWVVKLAMQLLSLLRPLPVTVTSAGNDDGIQARYNDPLCNAALEHGAENIICVENVMLSLGSRGDAMRAPDTNIAGHISAPGTGVLSTIPDDDYGYMSGTSFASPFVAGVAGFMLAVNPQLSASQVRDLLIRNSVEVSGGASDRVDAWASVMDIDRVMGDESVLRMMLDIDDGTEDGNLRVRYELLPSSPDYTYEEEDFDGDGGIGDGRIDMADFRTWRDWFLKTQDRIDDEHQQDHLKLDVNGDGVTEDAAKESIYPRGDFNGDGSLSLDDPAWVPGAVQDEVNDLDVFKLLFDDPHYLASELDALVWSDDFVLNPNTLFDNTGASSAEVEIWSVETGQLLDSRVIRPLDSLEILTYPPGKYGERYRVTVGETVFTFGNRRFFAGLGWDHFLRPVTSKTIPAQGAFLKVCNEDTPSAPAVLDLTALQVKPGDRIALYTVGDVAWTAGGPEVAGDAFAVFSASDELLDRTNRYRVPGAIPTDLTYVSGLDCKGNETDIPQDFQVPSRGVVVDVPQGATHLFVATHSTVYGDNRDADGDFEIQIVIINPDFPRQYWQTGPTQEGGAASSRPRR